MLFSVIEKNISKKLNLSIEEIKSYSPEEMRRYLEKKNKKKFSFVSEFPVIGRGNVLRDSVISSEELNKDVDRILRRK